MLKAYEEEGIRFKASTGKISSDQEVFYNPDKKVDRDINLALIKILKKEYAIKTGLELLSGSGIRGLRLARAGVKMTLNDYNPKAVELIKKNAQTNGVKVKVLNEEANKLLEKCEEFDYVDVDPFGTPVGYLKNAINKTRKIIAVTATDSSALCGAYPGACVRKYNSKPLKTEYAHELGLRILIKKCVLTGREVGKNLKPLFSYSRRDYFRVYFLITKTRTGRIGYFYHNFKTLERGENVKGEKIGPLWLSELWDNKTVKKLGDDVFFDKIKSEAAIKTVGYYHLPKIFSLTKKSMKLPEIIRRLESKGFKASKTHFDPQGIRTNATIKEIIDILNSKF